MAGEEVGGLGTWRVPRVAALRWGTPALGCRGWVEAGRGLNGATRGHWGKEKPFTGSPGRVPWENKRHEIQNKHGSTGRLERWGRGVGLSHLQLQPRKMLPEERCEEEGELTASLLCLPPRGEGAEQ